jgi:hypothetical protein
MMDDRHDREADRMARAHTLVARAAKSVEQLEDVAGQAFFRLTALTGMLGRMEELARSHDPEAVEAAALDAATVCREAEVLLRYVDSRQWTSVRVAGNGRRRARLRAWLGGGIAPGG